MYLSRRRSNTFRRFIRNDDCKRTALWRRPQRVRGPKGQSADARISQAKGQSIIPHFPMGDLYCCDRNAVTFYF